MRLLTQRNLKLKDLSEAIGIATNSISQWNVGMHAPNGLVLMDICDYLQCEPRDIYPEEE